MKSSTFSRKRTGKGSFEPEISDFHLFYQLTHMSATAEAGISRHKLFQLAQELSVPTAGYFADIYKLANNLRYNFPDACRLIGEHAKSASLRPFLLRMSDALKSGEPMPTFLSREADVQGEHYENAYGAQLESLNKWNDAYVAITVSATLIVIINIVSTMIYPVGDVMMVAMATGAMIVTAFVAYVLFRAAPQEAKDVRLSQGCKLQRRSLLLAKLLLPLAAVVAGILVLLDVSEGWVMLATGLTVAPVGITSLLFDNQVRKKDEEINSFVRSLGGTATSRGTTLTEALTEIEIDSFPALRSDVRLLGMRLNAIGHPALCWKRFAIESGSELVVQTTGVFYGAIDLGGDPERVGVLASTFALKASMLRARRKGIADSFSWLVVLMQGVLVALMVFLIGILNQFVTMLQDALSFAEDDAGPAVQEMQQLAGMAMNFNVPDVDVLNYMVVGVTLALTLINAFAIVGSEGSNVLKMTWYVALMLILAGASFLIVPSLVQGLVLGI
jgi:flagellar protein FlaJ